MKKKFFLLLIAIVVFSLSSCTLTLHANEELLSYFSFSIIYDNENTDLSSKNSSEESSSKWSESDKVASESTKEESSSDTSSEETSSTPETSEEDSSQPSTSEEDEPVLIENGTDLATSAPFISRAPERYGANNILTLQNAVVSQNSTVALKGEFNAVGAYPYNGYQVWTWAPRNL